MLVTFIITTVIFFFSTIYFYMKGRKKKSIDILESNRYGIFTAALTNNVTKENFTASMEFEVIKRSDKKVKISIDKNSITTNNSAYLKSNTRDSIKKMHDGWYDINSSNIEWLNPNPAIVREKNIDKVLSN